MDAWFAAASAGVPPARWCELLAHAFEAVWGRAARTLGSVTLMAIGDRVLHTAAEASPLLVSLRLEPTGLELAEFRALARGRDPAEVGEAICLVLVELLTVLGSLTAEILTPGLHVELSKVALDGVDDVGSGERAVT